MTQELEHANDTPRSALSRIIAKHGRAICDAPKRLEALLRDLCGDRRREINVIMGAHEERVAADLIAAGNSAARDALLARLAARLRDNLAYTPEAARWGVETWAVALGVLTEKELRERARAQQAEARRNTTATPVRDATTPVRDSEPPAGTRSGGGTQVSRPQQGTTYAHAPPKKQSTQPPPLSPPAPAPRRTPPARPNVFVPAPPPAQSLPHASPRREPPRRGLRLRSCLIVVALIFALIVAAVFAIPAVIVLLQEEQSRPSINEPRIR